MTDSVCWIDCPSWELDFYGLPHRIPWPADAPPEDALKEPFDAEQLVRAIEALGSKADERWRAFAGAAAKFEALGEALEENEIPQAATLLDEIDQILPGTSFVLFHRAYVARQDGRNEDALKLYEEAAAKTPNIAAIWINSGAVHASMGKRDEAIAAFHQALKVSPNQPMALEGLASLRAVVKLKAADPRQPNAFAYVDIPTFQNMAMQQIQQMTAPEQIQQYAEQLLRDGLAPQVALHGLERAEQLEPGNPRTAFMLCGAYQACGDPAKARDVMLRHTSAFPADGQAFFRLAQTQNALGDKAAESAALLSVLEVDPNFQPAIAIHFGLGRGEHDPAKEDALADFGRARNSWMAYVLAGAVARERGDYASALRQAERALAINPEGEEVLLHYAAALGDAKELGKLAATIRPAVESGKYSKRLDWNYAQVLQELGLTKDAITVLKNASIGAPEDFLRMANTMIDAWSGLVTGSGVRLEVNPAGVLLRPILISLPEGDGGVLFSIGAQLPAESRFPWRATAGESYVTLQQGYSGARTPTSLGAFRIRGINVNPNGPTTVDCDMNAMPDGTVHFRALQAGRKLPVMWQPRA